MKRRRRGELYRCIILVALIASLLLTACTGGGEQGWETSQEDGTQSLSDNWKNGFQDRGQDPIREGKTSTPYHIVGVSTAVPGADSKDSYSMITGAYSDESIFFLMSFRTEEGWRYSLQQYDIQNGSLSSDIRVFQEEGLQGYFDGLCLCGEKELAARFVSEDGEGIPQEIRLLTFDREGENVGNVPLDYAYREPTWGPMMSYNSFLSDGNYFYLVNYLESGLLVFDREGKEVRRDMPDAAAGFYYTTACSAPDGSVIVSKANLENRRTTLFYLQGDKENRLGEIPGVDHRTVAFGGDGSFYYFDGGIYLIRWDISTGEKRILLSSAETGLDTTWLAAITFSSGGRVLLHSWSSTNAGELEILTCSGEEVETGGNQMIFAYVRWSDDKFYSSLPVEYSKEHPQYPVILQTYKGDIGDIEVEREAYNTYRTRVMADILNGGGPDLLLLESEDARNLYENGALLDLTEYLDPELRDKIFPTALTRGVIDGKMIGVDPKLQGRVMMVSNAVWEGDGWTLEDVVRLVDERKPQYLIGAVDFTNSTIKNSPGSLLYHFFSQFPEKSSFLDLEAGTCDFENGTFVRFLEICKEYGEKPKLEEDQLYEMLKTGECLSTFVDVRNMQWFSQNMKPLEKSCHFVGFPGQAGYGCADSYELLVVNANSENKEAALEFLWELFSLETQQEISYECGTVREDVVRASVKEKGFNYLTEKKPGFDLGDGSYLSLEEKEDGGSFIEEYVTALKGLEGQDSRSQAVVDIVESEADLYFEGARTAEKTAEVIQNRVKLYLNENK